MAVRNFYIDADIDGRATMLSGGPRAKDGGMDIELYQRDDGKILRIASIRCRAHGNTLITSIEAAAENIAEPGSNLLCFKTER